MDGNGHKKAGTVDDGTRQAHMEKTRKMISMINTLILSSDILYVSGKTFVNLFKKTVHRKIESDIIKPKQENKKAEPDLRLPIKRSDSEQPQRVWVYYNTAPSLCVRKRRFFYGKFCTGIYDKAGWEDTK